MARSANNIQAHPGQASDGSKGQSHATAYQTNAQRLPQADCVHSLPSQSVDFSNKYSPPETDSLEYNNSTAHSLGSSINGPLDNQPQPQHKTQLTEEGQAKPIQGITITKRGRAANNGPRFHPYKPPTAHPKLESSSLQSHPQAASQDAIPSQNTLSVGNIMSPYPIRAIPPNYPTWSDTLTRSVNTHHVQATFSPSVLSNYSSLSGALGESKMTFTSPDGGSISIVDAPNQNPMDCHEASSFAPPASVHLGTQATALSGFNSMEDHLANGLYSSTLGSSESWDWSQRSLQNQVAIQGPINPNMLYLPGNKPVSDMNSIQNLTMEKPTETTIPAPVPMIFDHQASGQHLDTLRLPQSVSSPASSSAVPVTEGSPVCTNILAFMAKNAQRASVSDMTQPGVPESSTKRTNVIVSPTCMPRHSNSMIAGSITSSSNFFNDSPSIEETDFLSTSPFYDSDPHFLFPKGYFDFTEYQGDLVGTENDIPIIEREQTSTSDAAIRKWLNGLPSTGILPEPNSSMSDFHSSNIQANARLSPPVYSSDNINLRVSTAGGVRSFSASQPAMQRAPNFPHNVKGKDYFRHGQVPAAMPSHTGFIQHSSAAYPFVPTGASVTLMTHAGAGAFPAAAPTYLVAPFPHHQHPDPDSATTQVRQNLSEQPTEFVPPGVPSSHGNENHPGNPRPHSPSYNREPVSSQQAHQGTIQAGSCSSTSSQYMNSQNHNHSTFDPQRFKSVLSRTSAGAPLDSRQSVPAVHLLASVRAYATESLSH